MKLRTIKLGISDLDACIKLDRDSLDCLWTSSQWERELTDSKRICLGAAEYETQQLLGLCTAWIILDELHITSLAVDPQHQRKGIGKFMLAKLIKHAKSLKTKQIRLEVKDINMPAKAFYNSMGFERIGYRSNFYKDGTDAVVYKKKLITK